MKKYIFDSSSFFLKNNFLDPLFSLNSLRFDYIKKRNNLFEKNILDIGCGIGLLSEKFAIHKSFVTGIDKSKFLIDLAFKSAKKKNLNITYILGDFFEIKFLSKYDIVLCTEMLEHFNDIDNLFKFFNVIGKVNSLFYISSVSRMFFSYFKIIFLAEFISGKIIKNTHNFNNFINLSLLKNILVRNNFIISDIKFLDYNFFFNSSKLLNNNGINYLIEVKKVI